MLLFGTMFITDKVMQSREYHLGEGLINECIVRFIKNARVGNTAKASTYMKDSDYDNATFTKIFRERCVMLMVSSAESC